MQEYSLDQLLTFCKDDRLIDDFCDKGYIVTFSRGKMKYLLPPSDAQVFLLNLFLKHTGEEESSAEGENAQS